MIRTKRLQFVLVESRHKVALAASKRDLASMLGVSLPEEWPQFPEAFAPPSAGTEVVATGEWGGYFFVDAGLGALVGNGGFHGRPTAEGEAEVGYEIAPGFRNRGYATEALRGLVQFAFYDPGVRRVVAHTLAERNASNVVLERIGMTFAGELANEEVGKIWRWELPRS